MTTISDLLLQTPTFYYPDHQRIKNETEEIITLYPSFVPKLGTLKRQDKLIYLDGTIPIGYGRQTYQIPINIWFTKDFPNQRPEVYVVVKPEFIVKPGHLNVSPEGQCTIHELNMWLDYSSSLKKVMEEMIEAFSKDPPLRSNPRPPSKPTVTPLQTVEVKEPEINYGQVTETTFFTKEEFPTPQSPFFVQEDSSPKSQFFLKEDPIVYGEPLKPQNLSQSESQQETKSNIPDEVSKKPYPQQLNPFSQVNSNFPTYFSPNPSAPPSASSQPITYPFPAASQSTPLYSSQQMPYYTSNGSQPIPLYSSQPSFSTASQPTSLYSSQYPSSTVPQNNAYPFSTVPQSTPLYSPQYPSSTVSQTNAYPSSTVSQTNAYPFSTAPQSTPLYSQQYPPSTISQTNAYPSSTAPQSTPLYSQQYPSSTVSQTNAYPSSTVSQTNAYSSSTSQTPFYNPSLSTNQSSFQPKPYSVPPPTMLPKGFQSDKHN